MDPYDRNSVPLPLARSLQDLPEHLQERIRVLPPKQRARSSGDVNPTSLSDGPVVYWTHHAQRIDENPALDTARILATSLKRPLIVYQGLSERYRYASDRHHLFQLQSAVDLSRAYRGAGIRFVVHVETQDDDTRSLVQLARLSSVLVTEDFPGEPTDRWLERLRYLPRLTWIAVDTACVVPMRLVGRSFDRAFAFREATSGLYADRIDRSWPIVDEMPEPWRDELPFIPLDIESVDLNDLVSRCRIDHGIPPVADTLGGSVAGYERWNAFVEGTIKRYAAKRNDPLSGVASRMSAYLHYGMVSPMRLAREANASKAEKYLDELLIWRELAYGFCFYRPEYATTQALPAWAVKTLEMHQSDARAAIYSWETLSRARTEDRLWNACQESLIRHGELHNNLRMTWGKALLGWTRDAGDALELLIDLNHRFALDGRDPASYGGILWCLGQFDRPFFPEQPVLGTVRGRPTAEHAQRMNLPAYESHVGRPISRRSMSVAVIGAGIAGSMCARTLADHGVDVTVIEKSRGPGGRCATRRIGDQVLVDHGAPYVEFNDHRWSWLARSWEQDRIIAHWLGKFAHWPSASETEIPGQSPTRWVGVGGMNAIGKHLCRDLNCKNLHRVIELEATDLSYRLHVETQVFGGMNGKTTLEPFDAVVFAFPTEQILPMVPESCSWLGLIPKNPYGTCWTLMLVLEERWNLPVDAIRFSGNHIAWLSRESSKPGRHKKPDAWVIQMSDSWSALHLEASPEEIADRIMEELPAVGLPPMPRATQREAHRWRYAQTRSQSMPASCFWDEVMRLGACGDWFDVTGIEGALHSGRAMAGRILTWLISHGPAMNQVPSKQAPGSYIQGKLF